MGVKRVKQILCILIILALVALAIALGFPKSLVQKSKLNAENLRASTYGEFKEADSKIDGCNFVEFSAFFTRDLNNDGKAEKIKGTCKDITQKDTLYAEVNVLTQGSLKNGKITLNAENFTWTTAIVEDEIVAGDYIGKTTEINLKEVLSGRQKLLWGSISSNIGNNVNNYSKVSSMTLTGTYVDNNGNEVPISKTIDFTVDWYGKTETKVNRYYYSTNGYNSYDNQKYDIAGTIKDDNIELTFQTAISETSKQLLLNEQVLELEIPELNGYEALDAVVTDKNVEYEYNKETHILKITKKSEPNEQGDITNSIPRSNLYNIKLTYPLESYSSMTADSVVLNIKTKGYNYGYNNPNKEFKNPYESTAEGIITVTFSNPSGDVWNIYPYVGKYTYNNNSKTYKYQISKENVANIYNGNKDEDIKDIYPVSWQVVIGDYEKVKTITLEEEKADEFLNTDGNYESMSDYVTTTGVYFSNADQMLKEDGWIRLYDGETGEVVQEFRNDTWNKYTQGKPYEVNLKSIKIETSSPKASGTLNVYQIKELNDDLIVEKFSEEDFEKISYIYTNLKGSITLVDDVVSEDSTIITKGAFANYDMIHSAVNITMNPDAITNQETKNVDIKIQTLSGSEFERKWTNGVFLVELPEEIIGLDVQSVKSSDSSVKIISNQVFEQDGKQFIKIYTSNEKEATYTLTINADVTANPLISTTNKEIKLYSYNENGDNYYNKTQDVYDIDSDGNTTDYIGLESDLITIVAPSGLLTTEYVTNYDDLESRIIAPNIADIEKADETRTATINVNLTNNYSGTISDVKVLGKIPFEGNTAILNDINLNSQFTANMKSGIIVPENLKDYVTVYYSSNENPSNELENVANGWNKAEQIRDWNAVRSYLIDFGNYKLAKNENNVFTYEVEVPAGLGYNSVSYSNHAVYYNLDTENGKLATRTEPNKVGIQVVAKYGLELTKNQFAHDDIFVKGAIYSVTTLDQDGKEISKTAVTNENGVLNFSGLYVEREYTLREVASPSDYELNDKEIKFVGKINDNNFDIEISESSEGSFKEKAEITTDENGNYLVKAKVEDEVRYTLKINKTNEKGEILPGTRFSIVGKGKNTRYKTDKKGTIRIPGLYLGEEYVLTEVESEGYYVEGTSSKFTITRDADGILGIKTEDITLDGKVITENSILANAVITENTQNIQPQVEVTISNEKIPTYNLQIIKVEQNYNENDIEKLKRLEKATFILEGEELKDSIVETTNENGMVEISNLYLYVESKKDIVSGEYTIQETKAPSGYSNNAEEIRFKTSMNSDGKLQVEVINESEVTTLKQVIVEENTIKLVIEDRPLFKLTKIDSETGLPLANAKFMIKEVDSTGKEGGFAKDVNGNYVGEQDELGQWIVTTDENGIIMLPLKGGTYKSIEVGFPDGYQENDVEEFFKIAETQSDEEEEPKPDEPEEKKEDEEEPEYTEILKIGTKDELIDFANRVNGTGEYEGKAESFDGKKVILTNDIKLNEDDIADEKKENFTPIGIDYNHAFKGTFDGQNHKIENIYINSKNEYEYVGVFGYVSSNANKDVNIKNVKVSGKISNINENDSKAGGIVGFASAARNINISNCKNEVEISSNSSYAGGIVGSASAARNTNISNCENEGKISSNSNSSYSYAGGIIGYGSCGGDIAISNCKNGREISINSEVGYNYVGGIVGNATANSMSISNCENYEKRGEISSDSETGYNYVGGIVGYEQTNSASISNCRNKGEISSNSKAGSNYAGGIVGLDICTAGNVSIRVCENEGEISGIANGKGLSHVGGIIGEFNGPNVSSISKNISSCENKGEVSLISNSVSASQSGYAGGIVGSAAGGASVSISNCKNIRDMSSSGYAGGIVGAVMCNGKITNCENRGKVSSGSSYAGGIVGNIAYSKGSINNNANTGDVSSSGVSYSSVGGIVGYAGGIDGGINNNTNIGDISYSGTNSSCTGGIVGYGGGCGDIVNNYNTGEVNSNTSGDIFRNGTGGIAGLVEGCDIVKNYNIGKISNGEKTGGIVGNVGGSNVVNNYNTEEVINSNVAGGIVGYAGGSDVVNNYNIGKASGINDVGGIVGTVYNSDISNCYYLDSIQIESLNSNTNEYGIAISDEYMKSIEFYNALNVDNVWEYRAGKYPVLMKPLSENIVDNTEIIIQNTIKKYQITAEALPIEGGTISFEKSDVSDGDSEEPNEDKSSETVKIYENSTKNIVISPAEGYGISDITVNGKSIDYVIAENGKVTLSVKTEEFLKDIQENKHVVIKFDKIENIKPKLSVIVHHYLKDSEGNYTTIKIAKDDIYKGYADEFYSTEPHTDLEKLTLEKDTNGKFVIPNNASGKYTEEAIEIMYYYEAEPIELKIHHYLNGTQNKLVQDDIIHINPEVKFDENGNYEVVCEGSYSLSDNEKYNNLIKQYNLVNLSTTVQENVEISDTIKYNTDSELSYYYELKEYTITTKVELHPELRTDGLTNEKVELLVDGGKISGQGEDKYEVVVRGENSSKEIVITPYEGYTIEKVTLNSINDAGEKTTTILYGENRAIDAEVTCIENEDGSMSLISANSSADSVFQNVVENKEIIVKLAPKVGTIIVHHYFEGTGEEYNTLPERIILLDGTICEDEVKTEIIGESYATKAYTGSEVMYELVSTSGETNGKVTDGEKHVYYYYKRLEQKITTEVIKHEEIDEAGNTVLVKGGSISGENEEPYETVLKFDDSTKEIKIIPEETYQIKKVLINGEEISLDKILDDKSLILDKFESVDKDIHVAVEFEKIPTKVIIKYIDEETEKEISRQDIIEGIINTSYETNSKTIEGYELLENKLPENVKGIMTEDDIIVIYYYKKVKAPVEEPTKEPTEKPTEDKPTENPNKPENEPKEEEPGKDYEIPERKEEEKTTTPEIQNQSNLPKVLIKTGQSRAMVIGLVIIITSSIIVIIVINKKQK